MRLSIGSIFLLFCFVSCTPTIKVLSGFKNPKVKSKKEISDEISASFGSSHRNKTQDVFFRPSSDSTEIMQRMLSVFNGQILILDSIGQKLCFKEESHCSALQLSEISKSFHSSLAPCSPDKIADAVYDFESLNELMSDLEFENGDRLTSSSIEKGKFYILYFWGTFQSSKKAMKEDFSWFYNMVEDANEDIVILRINCDLRTDWGLKHKKRLKIRFRKRRGIDREYDLIFGQLPYLSKE